jgi:hypothetical protein
MLDVTWSFCQNQWLYVAPKGVENLFYSNVSGEQKLRG